MRTFVRLIFLLCTVSTMLQAQSAPAQRPSPAQDLTRLIQTYNLDVQQQKKVKALLERREAQYAEVQQLSDTKLIRQKRISVQKGAQSSFVQQLTPAQYEIFKKEQVRLRKARAEQSRQLRQQGVAAKSAQEQSNQFEF